MPEGRRKTGTRKLGASFDPPDTVPRFLSTNVGKMRLVAATQEIAQALLDKERAIHGANLQNVSGPKAGRKGEWLVYADVLVHL